jgi:hypothetical protein
MRTRGDMLRFAIAFALRRARKLVRGLRQGLSEEERFRAPAAATRRPLGTFTRIAVEHQ